jgi:type I restriction enzyme, S subunit
MGEWPRISLTELFEIRSGISKKADQFGQGYPFLSFKEVFNNYFVPKKLEQLVLTSEKEQEAFSVRRGDVFLTRTSETVDELGMSCVALQDYPKATFNGFTKRLRPKGEGILHPEFVGFYLRSPDFRQDILAFSNLMSTRASLNNEMISRLNIRVPSLSEQRAIAAVLSALDDKIELNRRMNETLEGMARAIFKDWFVDFGPTRAKQEVRSGSAATGNEIMQGREPYLAPEIWSLFPDLLDENGVPEGWKMVKAATVLNRLRCRRRFRKKDVKINGSIPIFEQGAGILLGYHDGEAEFLASLENPIFIFGDHTCVTKLSCRPFSISQNVIPLEGKKHSSIWTYYAIRELQIFQEYKRHWSDLIEKTLAEPSPDLSIKFSELVSPMVHKIEKNELESRTLAQTRDLLLPKLMSGEIRVRYTGTIMEVAR